MEVSPRIEGPLSTGRQVFVCVVGLAFAGLAACLLLPQRIVQTHWAVGTEDTRGAEVVLLMDTRGAPLQVLGDNPGGSDIEGRAGPGFEFEGAIRAAPRAATSVRLLHPSGAVRWERTVDAGQRAPIPPTALHGEGVWRLEIDAGGRSAWVELTGSLRTSRWERAPWGRTLPMSWLAAGLVAAIAVWLGKAGARVAGGLLLASGISMPFMTRGIRDLFTDLPPGEPLMVAVTATLVLSGAIVLGWTWPRPGEWPFGVVPVSLGALLLVGSYAYSRTLGRCVENPCLPQELIDDLLAEAGMVAGLLLVTSGGWALGRRSATPVTASGVPPRRAPVRPTASTSPR